jgi:hypothetical protein
LPCFTTPHDGPQIRDKELDNIDTVLDAVVELLKSLENLPHTVTLATDITEILLSPSDDSVRDFGWSTEEKFYQLALSLLQLPGSSFESQGGSSVKGRLASALFVRLCEIIPQSLKYHADAKKGERGAHAQLDPRVVFTWLNVMIDNVSRYDADIFAGRGPSFIHGLVRGCLKRGVTDEAGIDECIPMMALKLVRKIITSVSDRSAPLMVLEACLSLPSPSEIFDMTVSHSKFQSSLALDKNNDSAILELVRLLLCCVSLSPDIVVHENVWKSLFSGYGAGLGKLDTTMRRFFYACCKSEVRVLFFFNFF